MEFSIFLYFSGNEKVMQAEKAIFYTFSFDFQITMTFSDHF
jgi:hypothetical protein